MRTVSPEELIWSASIVRRRKSSWLCTAKPAASGSASSTTLQKAVSVLKTGSSWKLTRLKINSHYIHHVGYSWSDGTPLSHTNWGHGEPNNHEGREDCVEMVSSTNGSHSWWNDLNCDAHQDWICMIAKGKDPIVPPVPPPPVPGNQPPQCTCSRDSFGQWVCLYRCENYS